MANTMRKDFIYLPDGRGKGWLARLFNIRKANPPCLIDGFNFFTGEARTAPSGFAGTVGMAAHDNESWQVLWKQIGQEPPGDLPPGALARLELHVRKGLTTAFAIESAGLADGQLSLGWHIRQKAAADQALHACYAVVVAPQAPGGLRQSYRYDPA